MNEEMAREFKIFREQVYNKINEFEAILRALKLDEVVESIAEEVSREDY